MIDLTSACRRTADVLAKVDDEQLNAPTPCENLKLRGLVAHIGELALAFSAAARKDFGSGPTARPVPTVGRWMTTGAPAIRRGWPNSRAPGSSRRRGRA